MEKLHADGLVSHLAVCDLDAGKLKELLSWAQVCRQYCIHIKGELGTCPNMLYQAPVVIFIHYLNSSNSCFCLLYDYINLLNKYSSAEPFLPKDVLKVLYFAICTTICTHLNCMYLLIILVRRF